MTMEHILADFDRKMAAILQRVNGKVNRWLLHQRMREHARNSNKIDYMNPPTRYAGISVADLVSGKADWPEGF